MVSHGHLDWLGVTFPVSLRPNGMLPVTQSQADWRVEDRHNKNYPKTLVHETGAILMTGADERQGQFLVLSGDTLGVLRASGLPDREIIAHVLSAGGKPARVDVAIDLFASSITPADMATAYDQKRLKTPARRGIRTYGINDPYDTFYLGSGQSERFFRAYDKGAQLGIKDGEAWLRLELECNGLRARGLAHVRASADNTRQVINRASGAYVQSPANRESTQA